MFCVPFRGRSMRIQAIPHKDNFASHDAMQLTKELNHFGRLKTLRGQLKIERHAAPSRRQSQGTDRRYTAIMSGRDQLHGRLPPRCPGPLPIGLQQKACFIEKNDASTFASLSMSPLFLSVAIRVFANVPRPRDSARAPDAVASDRTNPIGAAIATPNSLRTSRQNVARSRQLPGGMSINRCHSPISMRLVPESSKLDAAETALSEADDRDAALIPKLRDLPFLSLWPNDPHSAMMHLQAALLPRAICPLVTGYLRSVASPPIPLQFL